jgi:hypothetical protein
MRLDNPAPPNLPLAPDQYERLYFESLTNILRLYFNRLENITRNLLGPEGGRFINIPFGSFYDTTDQTAASTTTAYAVSFNTTAYSNDVTLSGSQVTMVHEGYYNIQFSLQLVNTTNDTQDIDVWFRKNGVDIADSNSRFGLAPRKSISDPFHLIATLNFIESFNAGDYVELYWCTTDVGAYIEHYTAPSSPTRPAIPSAILTATFVSSIAG